MTNIYLTGVVDTVFDNGMVKLRTNRNNLYTPCSGMICKNNALIDAKNPIGAIKGQYVRFNIPDGKMGVGGAMCFGMPLLMVLIWGAFGYVNGETLGVGLRRHDFRRRRRRRAAQTLREKGP